MDHFVCKGECGAVTDKPGVCQTESCNKKGQDLILDQQKKIIFIAGMGGKEIQGIVTHLLPQLTEADSLVVSPHRNILELRGYLREADLGLVGEVVIKEDSQFYQVCHIKKDLTSPRVSLFGTQIWQSEVGEEYRRHILKSFIHHQDSLSKALVAHLRGLS